MRCRFLVSICLLMPAIAFALSGEVPEPTALPGQPAQSAPLSVSADQVVRHHARLVHAAYEDSWQAALRLQRVVKAFAASPSEEGLSQARQAWLDAREWYGLTEAFRFYGGPVDDERGPEGRLNAWPLDEAYIDGVKGRMQAGLIQNPKFRITKAQLSAFNERGGEENIATVWHAIEFLLWGQDISAEGPGARPAADFIDGQRAHADRRRQYLLVVTDLLVDDLQSLVRAWAPDARNYRQRFEQGGMESVRKMIVGMGSLSRGELAGERLEVALNTQDQEDEHSCFSDNTHRDVVGNAQGILQVWTGHASRLDGSALQGPSLHQLLSAKDPALAEQVQLQLTQSVRLAQAIQAPFDREIVGGKAAPGRLRIQATVDSLVSQSRLLVAAANRLGIQRLTLVKP